MDFVTEIEYEQIINGKEPQALNEVLTRVYNKAIEQALCHIPMMVNKLSKKIDNVNRIMKKYYDDNPEFIKYPDIVFQSVQRIEIEHTGLSFEEVIDMAAIDIRRKIDNIKGGMPNG